MLPTVFGAIVALLGAGCLMAPSRHIFCTMWALSIFGAASAIDLPALGGASVAPVNLFLLFYAIRLYGSPSLMPSMVDDISPGRPLFVFLLLLLWILVSALLSPRLFDGMMEVFSLARSSDNDGGLSILRPTSGNVSQAVYAVGGFCCAWLTSAYARQLGTGPIVRAIILTTVLHVTFAFVDIATSATGTSFILDPIHNGGYSLLTEDELGGIKRISGSFSEASAFAGFSLTLLALNGTLFLQGIHPKTTGALAALLTAFIILSTSSAGYITLALFFTGFALYAVARAVRGNRSPLALLLVGISLVLVALSAVVIFLPNLADTMQGVVDQSLLNKSTSDSAIERSSWNAQSWHVFLETYGVGAGIGSSRASSYVLVLLSNLGLPGLLLFGLLIGKLVLSRPREDADAAAAAVTIACQVGIIAALIPSLLVGTVYDLGSLFYCLVGVVAAGTVANNRVAYNAVSSTSHEFV